MKTIISILTLALTCLYFHPNLHAQQETGYVIVEYMKVKPGMNDEYRDCERAWKLIHQERVKAGYITGWELEQVCAGWWILWKENELPTGLMVALAT